MTRRERSGLAAFLRADTVLGRIEAAVLVTDPLGNLVYANAHAVELFGFPDHAELLAGRPVASLGFDERDLGKTSELVRQVLNGGAWDGTFTGVRSDGSRVFVQAQAVPLRRPAGAVDGIVVIARTAAGRASLRERDRIGLLEQIGERLARSLELNVTLQHVAETLVPQ